MKEYVEAVKKTSNGMGASIVIMDWDIPVKKKEQDTRELSKEERALKIAAFKTKHGTSYKYRLHTCYHDGENRECKTVEI